MPCRCACETPGSPPFAPPVIPSGLAATIYVFCAALIVTGAGLNLIIKPFQQEIRSFIKHKPQYIEQYNEKVPLATRNWIQDKLDDDDFKQKIQDTVTPYAMKGVSALGGIVEILLLPVLGVLFYSGRRGAKKRVYRAGSAPLFPGHNTDHCRI